MQAHYRVLPSSSVVGSLQRQYYFCLHDQRRRWLTKLLCDSAQAALEGIELNGATVAVGGFGPCGVPETLIDALCRSDSAKNLTVVALDVGTDHRGVGTLIRAGKSTCCARVVFCFPAANSV